MAVKEKKELKKSSVTENNSKKVASKKVSATKKSSGIKGWFKEVVSEFKKVRWPNKKEMIKYSIATIVFILFFALFFYIIEIVMYLLNQVK